MSAVNNLMHQTKLSWPHELVSVAQQCIWAYHVKRSKISFRNGVTEIKTHQITSFGSGWLLSLYKVTNEDERETISNQREHPNECDQLSQWDKYGGLLRIL